MTGFDDPEGPPLPPVEFAPLVAAPAATHRVWTVFVGFVGALAASALGAAFAVGSIALITSWRHRLAQGAWMTPPMTFAFAQSLIGKPVGLLATSLATGLSLAAFALIPASLSTELFADRLGLRARPRWLAWGVLAAWGLRGLADLTAALAELAHLAPRAALFGRVDGPAAAPPGVVLLALVVHAGVVPAGEELFFRGYVQSRLERRWGRRAAIGVTALMFASLHPADPAQAVFALLAGVFLGWVAARAGTIRVALVAHALHNAIAVLASSARRASSVTVTALWMLVGVAALAACVVAFRRLDPAEVT